MGKKRKADTKIKSVSGALQKIKKSRKPSSVHIKQEETGRKQHCQSRSHKSSRVPAVAENAA
jgi:hypothetical protein